jgi:methyl-accepting chemotaxis protein
MKTSQLFRANLIREIILFGAIATILSVFFGLTLRARLIEEFTNRGTAIANSIANSSVELLLSRDASTVQAMIDQFIDVESGVAYVFVVDDRQEFIAHTFVPGVPSEVLSITQGEKDRAVVRDVSVAEQGDFIDIASPILAGVVGYVHVGMDKGVIGATIRSAIISQIGLIALIFVIAVGLVYVQASQVSRPLVQLAQYAQDVAAESISARMVLQSGAELLSITERADEVGQLAQSFQRMVEEVNQREQSLQHRTALQQAAAEVSRAAIAVHDSDALVAQAAHLISEQFGFYHVGIFVLDGEYAVLQATSSGGGQQMLAAGHRVKVGQQDIIGYAAATGEHRIALDTDKDAVHFADTLLSETRSEIALPLRVGRRVIGVLDLQSRQAVAFDEDNVTVLQTMADQVAIAIENARLLRATQQTVQELSSTASEILAVTTQQASGANEQSAAISQTTTTVDELKTIAEQSVSRAQEVAGASRRTVEVSRAGQRSVQETIGSMGQIKVRVEGIAENILALAEQTQQIGEIISTVNDIAAQSNILALNASVEAARAGEYGKGFAVVAVEVRNLAEQSQQATAQVRAILSDIQKATNATVMATEEGTKRVDEGVQLAAQAQEAIEQLAGVIDESAQAAAQMVAGGRQQSAGVEQVALAMQNINQATVQSLASTRQAEKAARELNDLARSLTEIVEQYWL